MLVMRSGGHLRGFAAWIVAGFVVMFAFAPALDSLICAADGLDRPAAVAALDGAEAAAEAVADSAGKPHSNTADCDGLAGCMHGHCHHGAVAAAVTIADLSRQVFAGDARTFLQAPPLLSADLARATPPPRA